MEHIHVSLLTTLDPQYETTKIWASYRQCYSQYSATQLIHANAFTEDPEWVKDKAGTFIRECLDKSHESPLEHVQLTFGISGISRVATHQLVRHRIASYSQQSQRYVRSKINLNELYGDLDDGDYAPWRTLLMLPENVTEWLIERDELPSVLKMYELYGLMLEDGIKAENARYILPEGSRSKIVVSMNLRSLMNFFHTRLCDSAQEEIREVAKKMADLMLQEFPWLKGYVGPKCVRADKCLDGRSSVCEEHYAWRYEND